MALRSPLFARRSSRRGVLLLVVLSMLVLFMLIGTTFLMTSNYERTSAKKSGRAGRLGNHATKLLDRAIYQLVRGTENPHSVIRGHDLLRDLYGTDGFQGVIYSPPANVAFNPNDQNFADEVTRFAAAAAMDDPSTTRHDERLGPTQGQLIDIYVRALGWKVDDPLTPPPTNEGAGPTALTQPDLRHVLKLERNALGNGEIHTLSLTKGYYSGCVLTITSGQATGQSARIVDYDFVADLAAANPTANPPTTATRLVRFRVMRFERADGGPLQVDTTSNHAPEIKDLAGATFLVNGRPFNGTGIGYNPLAAAGTPRLNALEVFRVSNNDAVGAEVALLPNPVYFNPNSISNYMRGNNMPAQPFAIGIQATSFFGLNPALPQIPANPTPQQLAALQAALAQWKYPSFAGLGGADEPYDAVDYQNMFLALMTVTPRAQARIVLDSGPNSGRTPLELDDPQVFDNQGTYIAGSDFLRLDLEDVPLPSFHRPELVNFWYHRLLALLSEDMDPNEAVRAILRPYEDDGTLNQTVGPLSPRQAALIAAIKRKIMLRPIREDHPRFDGGNPQSVARRLGNVNNLVAGPDEDLISIPFWEVTGPWDVDNNGDDVPDSIWVYLGDPVQELEDGTRYKPLYAFLVVDLDSRLNVNAHGLAEHIKPPALIVDPNTDNVVLGDPAAGQAFPNLAGANSLTDTQFSSSILAQGLGYGPAEISLRPLLPAPLTPASAGNRREVANSEVDGYATLLRGRERLDGTIVSGKWGYSAISPSVPELASPGMNYRYVVSAGTSPTGEVAVPDLASQLQFIGYPWAITQLSVFGSPPDLMARYAIGLDYTGQPTYEVLRDANAWNNMLPRPLLTDSPYELDISSAQRRDTWAPSFNDAAAAFNASLSQSDDAAFATADLERILRGGDADAGTLPSRLWDVVDVFDPIRLMDYDQLRVYAATTAEFGIPNPNLNNPNDYPSILTAAQQMAAINRNLVTTDSFDLPVPGGNFLSRLINGADGQPGRANVDDNDDGAVDDPNEQGWGGSDDFHAVMNGVPILAATAPPDTSLQPTPPLLVPQNANIVDLLRYRVQFERLRRGLAVYNEADLSQVVQQLLAPEVIAGRRMDLNRPFGDGRDNGDGIDNDNDGAIDETGEDLNGDGVSDTLVEAGDPLMNGVVDDPLEAGDPFADSNASPNGRYDNGEQYYDMDGNGQYTPPLDRLWAGLTSEEIFFDYNHGSALLNGRLSDGRPYDGNNDFIYDSNEPMDGRIRANGVLQRQIFARHLYSLAMLLVDESYVATENVLANEEGNVNFIHFYYHLWYQQALQLSGGAALTPANIAAAETLVKPLWARKLTARRMAQWAINVADFRDPDSIMTPFEYDENPFDGWGVYVPDPSDNNPDRTQRAKIFVPLDGDIASDENLGAELPYPKKYNPNQPSGPQNRDDDALVEDSTRAVVWGAERPELLITETLSGHDRRCTDEGMDSSQAPGPNVPGGEQPNVSIFDSESQTPDYDLDQSLKPRGFLFVELYNPWSPDGQRPAELYGRTLIGPARGGRLSEPGVLLNQMSLLPVRVTDPATGRQVVRYSPVWRMAVVRDPVNGRMASELLVPANPLTDPAGFQEFQREFRKVYIKQLVRTDTDGFGFNSDEDAERLIYFTTGNDPDRSDDNRLDEEYDRTTPRPHMPKLVNPNLNVWVPPVQVHFQPLGNRPAMIPLTKRYFIAQVERQRGTAPNDRDVPIAPILPGRYAVVGSSGMQLTPGGGSTPNTYQPGQPQRFVTPISRLRGTANDPEQSDANHRRAMADTRRFELWPSVDPGVQQLLIGQNGGQEIVSLGGGNYVNVTDTNRDGTPDNLPVDINGDGQVNNLDGPVIDPTVAIPVEDLSISEPLEGYPSLRYQLMEQNATGDPVDVQQARLNQDGEWEYEIPYDRPFDMDLELVRNGTTQNYRSVHLQRLANPTLPWNPPPVDEEGKPNVMHQVNLPINPYLTIDSQSVDLTAFNGASEYERTELPTAAAMQNQRGMTTRDLLQEHYFAPLSASEFKTAPDHIVQGLINELVEKQILPQRATQWVTVEEFRGYTEDRIRTYLNRLEQKKGGNVNDRATLLDPTFGGERGWHRLRRALPDDAVAQAANRGNYRETSFKQRLHMKSQERGAHHLRYDFDPSDEGWEVDSAWEPRLLWKQERPNVTLIFKTGTQEKMLSDLKNVWSRRVLIGRLGPIDSQPTDPQRDPMITLTQDERDRADWLKANTTIDDNDKQHVFDYIVEQTLGFINEAYAPNLDRAGGDDSPAFMKSLQVGAPEVVTMPTRRSPAAPEPEELRRWNVLPRQLVDMSPADELNRRQKLMRSTFPWLAWNNRPFVSSEELMQVPGTSSSLMLRYFSVINANTKNPYDGMSVDDDPDNTGTTTIERYARQLGIFGHLLNFFNTADKPAGTYNGTAGDPAPFSGAPHFYRILEYVHVPSRYVGTETRLTAEFFNDVLGDDPTDGVDAMGTDLTGFDDPRYNFQPPFNTVSRYREPGRVNLNTVTGRRIAGIPNSDPDESIPSKLWSEVYDGIMHREKDGNVVDMSSGIPVLVQAGHFGPSWRDIVLSRRGYAQLDAGASIDPNTSYGSIEKPGNGVPPDAFAAGLNPNFPTMFANPFRTPDAGDLVPLPQMVRYGVDAGWQRRHHFNPGGGPWGAPGDDDKNGISDDIREAGFGRDQLVVDPATGALLPVNSASPFPVAQSGNPLFAESSSAPFIDGNRNSYMMYQPMSRLGNLVTNRSGVFAVWITVGYFEVEKAPTADPRLPDWGNKALYDRFGGDINLYNRAYPDGYMLGREVGSDTGDVKRPRGFYIIDRTEEVGFKPGEDLNVEKTIRLRRRID